MSKIKCHRIDDINQRNILTLAEYLTKINKISGVDSKAIIDFFELMYLKGYIRLMKSSSKFEMVVKLKNPTPANHVPLYLAEFERIFDF